jgi:serine beta-lactamase-like protein LACTB, mitochondrial
VSKLFSILIGFFLIHTFLVNQVFPQKKIVDSKYKKSIIESQKMVGDLMSKQSVPGLAIAVSINGKLVWSEGFGFADLESQAPVSPQTRFRIGSVSKLLTAAAITKLFEQGLLDLDAPVQNYVPSFPAKEYEITARELLGHLAGIRHYKREEYINRQRYDKISDSLKIFQTDALLHQPKSKYLYSSYGYVLLSSVIEGVSKEDYLNYMQTHLFNPLGLKNTAADDSRKIIRHRARFYSKSSDGQISNETFVDTSDKLAAGGFLSTAEDLVIFGSESLQGGFFKPETRSLIFTSQKTLDGKETSVGFGWRIGKDGKGRTIYYHGGDAVGGRAFLIAYPAENVVIAITCNLTFAKVTEVEAANFADLFLK